jgi:hypothetical protein
LIQLWSASLFCLDGKGNNSFLYYKLFRLVRLRAYISIENISRPFPNTVGVQPLTGLWGRKGRFSIDMNALRATNNRFIMILTKGNVEGRRRRPIFITPGEAKRPGDTETPLLSTPKLVELTRRQVVTWKSIDICSTRFGHSHQAKGWRPAITQPNATRWVK